MIRIPRTPYIIYTPYLTKQCIVHNYSACDLFVNFSSNRPDKNNHDAFVERGIYVSPDLNTNAIAINSDTPLVGRAYVVPLPEVRYPPSFSSATSEHIISQYPTSNQTLPSFPLDFLNYYAFSPATTYSQPESRMNDYRYIVEYHPYASAWSSCGGREPLPVRKEFANYQYYMTGNEPITIIKTNRTLESYRFVKHESFQDRSSITRFFDAHPPSFFFYAKIYVNLTPSSNWQLEVQFIDISIQRTFLVYQRTMPANTLPNISIFHIIPTPINRILSVKISTIGQNIIDVDMVAW